MGGGLNCPEEAAHGSSWGEDHRLLAKLGLQAQTFFFSVISNSSKDSSNHPTKHAGVGVRGG